MMMSTIPAFRLNQASVTGLSKKWYLALGRGLVALIVGALALMVPAAAALILVTAYFLLDGVLAIAFGAEIRSSRWICGTFLLEGIAGIVASIFVLTSGTNRTDLILIVAVWAVLTGLLEIAAATALPNASWLVASLGFVSLGFGAVLFAWPLIALLTFLYLMTSYAVIAAVVFLLAALVLRRVLVEGNHEHR